MPNNFCLSACLDHTQFSLLQCHLPPAVRCFIHLGCNRQKSLSSELIGSKLLTAFGACVFFLCHKLRRNSSMVDVEYSRDFSSAMIPDDDHLLAIVSNTCLSWNDEIFIWEARGSSVLPPKTAKCINYEQCKMQDAWPCLVAVIMSELLLSRAAVS